MRVPTKHIQSTQVHGENFQIFKDLNITMDKYELHSKFYSLDMDGVDVFLGYLWIQLCLKLGLIETWIFSF